MTTQIPFGKLKGMPFAEVPVEENDYLAWLAAAIDPNKSPKSSAAAIAEVNKRGLKKEYNKYVAKEAAKAKAPAATSNEPPDDRTRDYMCIATKAAVDEKRLQRALQAPIVECPHCGAEVRFRLESADAE